MRPVRPAMKAGALASAMALGALGQAGTSQAAIAVPSAVSSPGVTGSPSGPGGQPPGPPRSPSAGASLASRTPRLPAGQRQVCPPVFRPGQMECMSVIRVPARRAGAFSAAGPVAGYGPASLQSAYRLTSASARDGRGATIAIVDAYSNPDAARNLATYRRHFHLPPCTVARGCLRIVNQNGRARPLPGARYNWGVEESLDLDMVSAICPNCRILLVEARSASIGDLAKAENAAVSSGARFVSNSWSGSEFTGQQAYDHYFNRPGDAVVVASGDFGYGSQYPTDTQYVTSVGGTTLRHQSSAGRAWSEQAWGASGGTEGTGSGCSTLEPKPSWQTGDNVAPGGCLNRTQNDVAADGDPNTGAAVYDSYQTGGGWIVVGGTSEATPIITAVYALAGTPARRTYPASYPYQHPARLFDVRSGVNGQCEPNRQYLCHGRPGYDGPTGLGTPDGTGGFSGRGAAHRVTLIDPGPQDLQAGASVTVRVSGIDGRAAARSLAYTATGLPPGLSIAARPRSTDAVITGTLPAAPGRFVITVSGRDRLTGQVGSTSFTLVAAGSLADAFPGSGRVALDQGGSLDGLCLTDSGGVAAGRPVVISSCGHELPSQAWRYVPDGRPGGAGVLTINNRCLSVSGRRSGSRGQLESCDGTGGQAWQYLFGQLLNPASGLCLADPGGSRTQGTQVRISACDHGHEQTWTLAATPVASAIGGMCLNQETSDGRIDIAGCNSQAAQLWTQQPDGTIQTGSGSCLDVGPNALDGARVFAGGCEPPSDNASQVWLWGPGGELINAFSGKCLADPGNATSGGTTLRQEDCYGEPGEIWAVN